MVNGYLFGVYFLLSKVTLTPYSFPPNGGLSFVTLTLQYSIWGKSLIRVSKILRDMFSNKCDGVSNKCLMVW